MPACKSPGRCRARYDPMNAQNADFGRAVLVRNPNEGKIKFALLPGSSIAKWRDAVSASTPIARSKPRIVAKTFSGKLNALVPSERIITTGKASKPKTATRPAPTRFGAIVVARTNRPGPYTKTKRLVTRMVQASWNAAQTTKTNDVKPRASNTPAKRLGRKR